MILNYTAPIMDSNGEVEGAIIVNHDITDRKRAEQALRENEEKLRSALDASPFPVAIVDREDNNILYWSRSAQTLFGHTAPTAPEWYQIAYPDPDYRQDVINRWKPCVAEASKAGRPVNAGEYRVTCRDGSVRICELYATFIKDNLVVTFNDITARKQAEALLRESEERLELVLEGSQLGFWDWDMETGKVHRNPQWAEMLGYTLPEIEFSVRQWTDLHHPDDRAAAWKSIQDHLGGRTPVHRSEYRMLTKDGQYKWILDQARVVRRDAQGKPLRMCGTHTDITARKKAETELRESEKLLRLIAENYPNSYLSIIEKDLTVGFTSGQEFKKQKLDPNAFVGLTLEQVFGVLTPIARKHYLETFAGEETSFELFINNQYQCYRTTPLRNAEGEIDRILSVVEDITERKQLELERQKFFLIAESSSEFIGMCDLDMQPLYVNPAGQRMVGLPDLAAACRVKVQDYFFPEDQRFIAEEFFPRVLREGHGDVEIRLRHFQTGEPIWMFYYLFHVRDANGDLIGWATVSRDITERRKAEGEIRKLNAELEQRVIERTAQLEASNKELEAFSYSVSHDLKAPLRHINGYVDLLNEKYYEALDEKARHYLDTITRASSQMGTLIDELLRYSRTGRKELSYTKLDLNTLLPEVMKELEPAVRGREINWEIQNLPKVVGDYALLKLVWANLLDNAVKYTRNQPAAKISVGYEVEAQDFVFCVQDNGVGFDMKYAHKLFGVFQRLHSPAEFDGTGIGLANVQRIIHKHAGRVWAEAEPGKGARFYFSLPRIGEEHHD
jgi:PAS domain S-box-containing protein